MFPSNLHNLLGSALFKFVTLYFLQEREVKQLNGNNQFCYTADRNIMWQSYSHCLSIRYYFPLYFVEYSSWKI